MNKADLVPVDVAQSANCGWRTLRIVFTAQPAANAGYVAFWCDTCMEGIHVCRAPVPDGVTVRPMDKPAEERNPRVPDYRLVTLTTDREGPSDSRPS
ncbi:hypothetical protein EV382_2231 [Micromonospora violae]|uniref:Uncharacterized protein n=1 Tax=Micromonospora violae TaxID=1278207 RepID=A0A4Q7UD00_9ACTN|nr:hypothetical protein EV382_2231 [Micromonospora violae]